jgi:cytochrome c-type biogenesis protein CcmH/NrfG
VISRPVRVSSQQLAFQSPLRDGDFEGKHSIGLITVLAATGTMSSTKAALKAAKAALDAKKYDEAIGHAQTALSSDPKNYFANLFLGRAFDKLGKPVEAAKAYDEATKIKPDEDQAWLGLRVLYEGQGTKSVNEYISVCVRLAEIYAEA